MENLSKAWILIPINASLLLPAMAAENEEAKRPQSANDIIERPGVLTPKGTFAFDASLGYTQNSSNQVSVVGYTVLPTLLVGRIEVSDSDRTTVTAGLTMRYGLTNSTEVELRLPYVYRSDQISTRPIQDGAESETINTSLDGGGLGDVEFGIRRQFNFATAPYWVGGMIIKSNTGKSPYEVDVDATTNALKEVPTGSGFWSVEPSISMIYPSDPAVIYSSLSYIYNFADNIKLASGQKINVDLGDTISLSGGFGFAINPDFSFSVGLSHKTILKSKLNGVENDNAKLLQLDSLNFGINYAISRSTSLGISAQAGLTEDTPDFQLSVRVPFTF